MADAFPSTKSWFLQSFVDIRNCVRAWPQILLELPTLKVVDINPLTPLLYVFSLCFISSPLGELSNEFMTQEQLKLAIILKWCQACEWRMKDYHRLFGMMFNYNHYEMLRLRSSSAEVRERAAGSLELARNNLIDFMAARCFPDNVRRAVWYVSKCH